jgi:hypothetical protein
MKREAITVLGAAFMLSIAACSDERLATSSDVGSTDGRNKIAQASTAPFACGVEYTVVSTLSDDNLASYGMPALTDTARVCGTWTGSDYRVHVEQIGSSEPPSETSDQLKVAMYDGGVTSGTEATGAPVGDPTYVASSAFDLGQASPNEQQASYNDPYYGVTASGGGGGGGDTCIQDCYATIRADATAFAKTENPRAKEVKEKEHGITRPSTRALVGDKDEIEKGGNGQRRFRSVKGDEETILEVDPATELITAQETNSPKGKTRATLKWKKTKDKTGDRYVRELMEVTHTEVVEGQTNTSKATLRILDLKLGGQP